MNLKPWLGVARLWSLTASTMPLILGSLLAAWHGSLSWPLFALILPCGWLMQISCNMLNTYGDFKSGVDTPARPPNAPQLVNGELTPANLLWGATILLLIAAILALITTLIVGWKLLYFALIGFLGVTLYTTGIRYKYYGLGVPLVALLMGTLMTAAAYFVHTTTWSWQVVLASTPLSALVAAIMHANDIRDVDSDKAANIRTTAILLGSPAMHYLFYTLHLTPYLITPLAVALKALPPLTLLLFLALPLSIHTIRTCAAQTPSATASLERLSAKVHLIVNTLTTLGLLLTTIQ